jgi:hypothetical protein
VSLAYDLDYSERTSGTSSTAQPRPARSSGSQIVAFSQTRTDWQPFAARRLNEIIRLPVGWDGHQGKPVNATIASYSYNLLEALLTMPAVPMPSITPLSYGGLVLEWHRRGWDVEIEIDAPASHHLFAHELASGEEWESWLGPQLTQLQGIIKRISD